METKLVFLNNQRASYDVGLAREKQLILVLKSDGQEMC